MYTEIGLHILEILLECNLPFFVILQEITNIFDPFSYHRLNLQKIRKKLLANIFYWLALSFALHLEHKVLLFILLFLKDHLCIVIFFYFLSDIIALFIDIFTFLSILNEKTSSHRRFYRSFIKLEWQRFFDNIKATFVTFIGFNYKQLFLLLMILIVIHYYTFDQYDFRLFIKKSIKIWSKSKWMAYWYKLSRDLLAFLFDDFITYCLSHFP